MAQIFKNNTTGTLASELAAGATACTLNAGHTFTDPGSDWYLATLVGVTGTTETSWEIVKVTNVATNALTIERAQESTSDATWPAGTRIEARLTAGATESKANLGAAAYAATTDFAAASHNQAETTITFTDVSTGNASTTAHGFAPKATAPASGLRSVLAIDNGETVRSDKALFDATNPAELGTASPGAAMTAARRDHVHALPALGKILQVVAGTTTTKVELNTQTYTNLGLSVSITPSAASSNVLVFATLPGVWVHGTATSAAAARLQRDSTTLVTHPYNGFLPEMTTQFSFCYLDSPSSTSAVTYSMQGACSRAGDLVTFMDSREISTIVAMEVAA